MIVAIMYILLYSVFLCIHSYIISIILGLSEKANENGKLSYIWRESTPEEKALLVIVLVPYLPIMLLAIPYDFIMKWIRKK
jgi:hypothetical protein